MLLEPASCRCSLGLIFTSEVPTWDKTCTERLREDLRLRDSCLCDLSSYSTLPWLLVTRFWETWWCTVDWEALLSFASFNVLTCYWQMSSSNFSRFLSSFKRSSCWTNSLVAAASLPLVATCSRSVFTWVSLRCRSALRDRLRSCKATISSFIYFSCRWSHS